MLTGGHVPKVVDDERMRYQTLREVRKYRAQTPSEVATKHKQPPVCKESLACEASVYCRSYCVWFLAITVVLCMPLVVVTVAAILDKFRYCKPKIRPVSEANYQRKQTQGEPMSEHIIAVTKLVITYGTS